MIGDEEKDMERESTASKKVGKRRSRMKMLNNSSEGKEFLVLRDMMGEKGVKVTADDGGKRLSSSD